MYIETNAALLSYSKTSFELGPTHTALWQSVDHPIRFVQLKYLAEICCFIGFAIFSIYSTKCSVVATVSEKLFLLELLLWSKIQTTWLTIEEYLPVLIRALSLSTSAFF